MAKQPEYPSTPEGHQVYQKERMEDFRKRFMGKRLTNSRFRRTHPLVQAFLSRKTYPEMWKFWVEDELGVIMGQIQHKGEFLGPIYGLRRDGVTVVLNTHGNYDLAFDEAMRTGTRSF